MLPNHEMLNDEQSVFDENNSGDFVANLMKLASGSKKSTPVSDNETGGIDGTDVRKSLLKYLATKAVKNVRREEGF